MQNRIEDLERQIAQLQKHIDSFSCVQSPSLESQVEGLLSSQNAVYHGPDTVTNFNDFSMDHVITEFKKQAPDVWQLLNNLGNTGQFSEDTEQHQLAVPNHFLLEYSTEDQITQESRSSVAC